MVGSVNCSSQVAGKIMEDLTNMCDVLKVILNISMYAVTVLVVVTVFA